MSEADVQRDEQWAASAEDAARAVVEERLKSLNTSCPGIIKAFDRAKLTATVQPALDQLWIEVDGKVTRVPIPLCADVPVQFPGGGGCMLTFDVADGDECILVFSQRCINEWWQNGGQQVPGEHRFHDLSDGMAIVGITSQPRAAGLAGGVASGGAELRTRDGSVLIRVDDGTVTLGGVAGARTLLAPDMVGVLTPLTKTWLNAVGSAAGAGPFPTDALTALVKGK